MLYTHVLYLGLFLVVQKELIGLVSSFPGSPPVNLPSTSSLLSPHRSALLDSTRGSESSFRLIHSNQVHRHLAHSHHHQPHHPIQEAHFVINPEQANRLAFTPLYHTGVITHFQNQPQYQPGYPVQSETFISEARDFIPAVTSPVLNATSSTRPSFLPRGFDPNLFEYVDEEPFPEEDDDDHALILPPPSPIVQDQIDQNSIDSGSLLGDRSISRTAPDTSATVWSNLKGNVVRVLNPVRISSRYNQGCVGGTKCQFFLVCWMSGGSLGSSCGPLYTCCVTPSSQEIQPAFYGPVVNDPYCGRSSARISRIVGGSDASFGQFPWQVSSNLLEIRSHPCVSTLCYLVTVIVIEKVL